MAEQIFGQDTNNGTDGHNLMVVEDDGSINVGLEYTEDNPLPVEIPPLVSLLNSTSTPLLANNAFTGSAERCNGYGIIYINTYSDVASAVDGLEVQQSSDGVEWDHCDEFTLSAGAGKNFSINPYAKWYRIVYTNGALDQTEFRLQVILKANGLASSHRIQDPIIGDDDAQLVKAVGTGLSPDGTFRNFLADNDGNQNINDRSSGLNIAQGNVTDQSGVAKFGNAPNFDTADGFVTVWDGAEDGTAWELMRYVYSSTADIDSVSSSSAADTQAVTVIGLDADYNEVTQEVTLNGQSRVALTTPLIRVYRAYNNNGTEFVGHVFVFVNGALTGGVPDTNADIRAVVDPDNQQTLMCVYTVPAGKTGYLTRGYASTSGGSKLSAYVIKFFARDFGKVFRLQNVNSISDTGSSSIILDYFVPLKIEEKTDLEVRVQSIASPAAVGNAVSAGFDLVLVDNV